MGLNDAETSYKLGLDYMEKKDFESAYREFNRLIFSGEHYGLSETKKVEIFMNRGISKYNIAKNEQELCEAADDWIDVLYKHPNSPYNSEAKRLIQMALQNSNSYTLQVFVKGMMQQRNLYL